MRIGAITGARCRPNSITHNHLVTRFLCHTILTRHFTHRREKKKRKKLEEREFQESKIDSEMKRRETKEGRKSHEKIEQNFDELESEEDNMDDFIASSDSEEEHYRGGNLNLEDDDEEGEDLFDVESSDSDDEVEVLEELSTSRKVHNLDNNSDSDGDEESDNDKRRKEKRKNKEVRRSSMKSSNSKTYADDDFLASDDDFIDDGSESDQSNSAPFSHAALDAKMMQDQAENEDLLDVFMSNRKMDKREAFEIWFKDLVYQCQGYLEGKKYKRVKTAKNAFKAIESVINTHRESSFASGAWKAEFYEDLTHRPLYQVTQCSIDGNDAVCQICGRSSHTIENQIVISGPPYDNAETIKFDCDWEKAFNYKSDPEWAYLKNPDANSDSDSDSDFDAEKEKDDKPLEESLYFVGNHCAMRARAYHQLAHFKFIVFDGIKQRMLGETDSLRKRAAKAKNGSTIDEYFGRASGDQAEGGKKGKMKSANGKTAQEIIKRDKKFRDDTYQRYQSLIDQAGNAALAGGGSTREKLDRLARRMDI